MMIALLLRLRAQVSAIAAVCGLLACSSGTTTSVSPDGGTVGVVADAESCKSAHPASQAPSQPCCTEWGADACGAGLFCAAFDGRTQATCYPDRSRLGGASCSADTQCLSNACDATQVCKGVPGGKCDPSIGCGTALDSEARYYCAAVSGGAPACRPCTSSSPDPVCGGTPADGGVVSPRACVSSCTMNAQCQSSCPLLPGGSQCCDATAGVCFGLKSPTCPGP